MNNPLPVNAVVWAEIPVTDMDKSKSFYAAVTGHELNHEKNAPNPMANFACKDVMQGVAGHIYPGKPAAGGSGNTIHIAVAGKVEDAMERVTESGGKVVSPVIEIPAGRFAYCLDPDGNSIGLFEK